VTRLNPAPISPIEAHTVATLPDVHLGAKTVWLYLRAVADPQRRKDLADALGLDGSTITRSLKALSDHGLVRQVHGVWLAEVAE
jgi:hypothetical protein